MDVIVQRTLKGSFTSFTYLPKPTPNEKRLLSYLVKVYPIWVSYKTLEQIFLPTMGTVKNRVRGLYKKGYLDKHKSKDGTIRFRIKSKVYSQLTKGRLKR